MKRPILRRGAKDARKQLSASAPLTPSVILGSKRPPQSVTIGMWALIVFTIVPEGFNYSAPDVTGAIALPTEGSPLSRITWLALMAFGAITTLSRTGAMLKLVRRINPFLLLFFALAATSVLWSIEPAVTVRRLIRAATILLDAIALGVATARISTLQETLRPPLTLLIVGSIIFVIVAPDMAIERATSFELLGAWHGLTPHKNSLGSISAVTFLLWWHAWLNKETSRLTAVLCAIASAICLVRSRSSTSLMATVFASVLMLMLMRSPPALRRYLPYIIAVFVGALLAYSLAVLNLIPGSDVLLSPIVSLTGKDQTFSGRTPIWQILNEHIARSPYLGSGYGAYWNEVPNSPSMEMMQRLYFYPTEGHNGYLDVINDLGYVGALCLVTYLFTFLRQGLRIFIPFRAQGSLFLCLLFEQMIGNLSESRWFNTLSFDFVLMTIVTVCMGRVLLEIENKRR